MLNRRHVIASGARLAALFAPFSLGLVAPAQAAEGALPALGSTLALPTAELFDGRAWKPAEARGKVLVVYWWASWCPFCAVQSPYIEALWQAQRQRGMDVLALSIDREPAAARTYLKAKSYTFPAALATPEVLRAMPKPRGLPVVVVLRVDGAGRTGKVLFAEAGEMFPEDVQGLKKFL